MKVRNYFFLIYLHTGVFKWNDLFSSLVNLPVEKTCLNIECISAAAA
jgi:hypothetical protein